MRRLGLNMSLALFTCGLLLACAWLGFGTRGAIICALGAGAGLIALLALNATLLLRPGVQILLVLLSVGFMGPASLGLAWYASHAFGVATPLSDLGLGAMLAAVLALGVAEARQADLQAFAGELRGNGGLRPNTDGTVDFRLRGAPRKGPFGPYFRPFRVVAWIDILFALGFGVLLLVVAPTAFTSAETLGAGNAPWVFVIVFGGTGWLGRVVWTGAVVNWRLLAAIRNGQVTVPG